MRVKTGVVRRHKHKKVLRAAKGFWMTRSTRYKAANEAVMHSGMYAFVGRKNRKRDMRKTWIIRLNIALRELGSTYSKFISQMLAKKVSLNRKSLSEIAIHDPDTFSTIFKFITK